MNPSRIEPRTLSGFRDYLPEAMIPRERLIATAQKVYRSYGFSPIDTPAMEILEVLAGKGSEETDRQMYRIESNSETEAKAKAGLRFDLTVPLARFTAQHFDKLGLPFKRYHIATVWRGERAQRGRYREFMQCDFDTIGTKHVSADIETALVINDLLRAIGFERFEIRLNNRMVLTGLLTKLGIAEKSTAILRSLDKLGKIGREKVAEEMISAAGLSADQSEQVLQLAGLSGSSDEILSQLSKLVAGNELGEAGVDRLAQILAGAKAGGMPAGQLQIDVSIARGLDYYTGAIFETFLSDLPTIGSVCSGGRYDNLAAMFTKQELPGIGASLGLDRLLAAMEELKMIDPVRTPAPVFIPFFDKDRLANYLALAASLRAAGIGTEVFPDPKKLGQQLQYADRRGFRLAIIAGSRELDAGTCQVKNLQSGEAIEVTLAEAVAKVQELLA